MAKENIQLISIDGGGLRNAIPREGVALISVRNAQEFIEEVTTGLKKQILEEFATVEPHLQINIENSTTSEKAVSEADSRKIILVLKSLHNGVYRMSPDVKDLGRIFKQCSKSGTERRKLKNP